jgi:hypothetical protein
MDAASEEKTTSEPVAAAKATSRPVTSAGLSSPMSRPATPASTPLAAKAGGGLGRLPLRKGNQTSNEGVDSNAGNYRETENSIKSTSKNIFLDSDGFDDAIPY